MFIVPEHKPPDRENQLHGEECVGNKIMEEILFWFEELYLLIFIVVVAFLMWLVPKLMVWASRNIDVSRSPREPKEQGKLC